MLTLIREAFDVGRDQIEGPTWIVGASYAITATLPPRTSEAELHVMHLNLLKERFGLSYHRVPKEDRGYELRVDAEGLKIGPVTVEAAAPNSQSVGVGQIQRAAPNPGVDWIWQRSVEGGIVRITFKDASMGALAGALRMEFAGVGAPVAVINKTGLSGKYTFQIVYENSQSPGPDITAALRSQLGLRLVQAKIGRDHIVIDHLDWVPTEN